MGHHLTILICTHNRAELLRKTLDSLNRAHRPVRLTVDILVIANACQDATQRMLDSDVQQPTAEEHLPMRWFDEPRAGKSNALNRGIAELRGDWFAIVDDDQRVASDFLTQIEQAIEAHPEANMLCGRILPDWDGSEPTWVHDDGPYRIYPLPIPRQDFGEASRKLGLDGPIPGGGNQIMRVDVVRRVGVFSTALGPRGHDLRGGEDTEFMLRALRQGERLWYVPAIVQYHYVDATRLSLQYLMRKSYRRSASSIKLHEYNKTHGVPLYLYRKLVGYAANAMIALNQRRRRFYLVRTAAALGEIAGHLRQCTPARAMSSPSSSESD